MSALQQYEIDSDGCLRHRPCDDQVLVDVDEVNLGEILSAAVEHVCSRPDAELPFRTETIHLHPDGVTPETCEKCNPTRCGDPTCTRRDNHNHRPSLADQVAAKPDPWIDDVNGTRLAVVSSDSWDLDQRPAALAQPTWEAIFSAMVTARALGSVGCTTNDPDTGLRYRATRRDRALNGLQSPLWDIYLLDTTAPVTATESRCGHDACHQRRTCVYDPLR